MLTLYNSTILSIFEYAAICIITAADCHLQKIQMIQNQALRLCLDAPAYVSIHDLHDCSGLQTIKNHLTGVVQKRLTLMKHQSPIMQPTIQEHQRVKHIKENISVLDIISL